MSNSNGSRVRESPQILVVIVTYNSSRTIGGLLRDLISEAETERLTIVVVDNASTDETVHEIEEFGPVTIIEMGRNAGYSAAINRGLSNLKTEQFILILNPDVRVTPLAIRSLREAAMQQRVGAAVPQLRTTNGAVHKSLRREPTLFRSVFDSIFGRRMRFAPPIFSEVIWNPREYDYQRDVEWATGAVLMIPASVARIIGPWDERFFLYSEETDYMRRLRESGYRIVYEPVAQFEHIGGASGQSGKLLAIMTWSRVMYADKWSGPAAAAITLWVQLARHILRFAIPDHRRALRELCERDHASSSE